MAAILQPCCQGGAIAVHRADQRTIPIVHEDSDMPSLAEDTANDLVFGND